MAFPEDVNAIAGLAWPLLVGGAVGVLLPEIRKVIRSRAFVVKAGGVEISVQEASDRLADNVEDVREQISALKARVGAGPPATNGDTAVPAIADGLTKLGAILWVDDFPENNVYEVQALARKGVTTMQVRCTREAMALLVRDGGRAFDAVVSDMGRVEDGDERAEAGLELIRNMRVEAVDLPVVFYASAPAVSRTRAAAMDAGAFAITSSATELFEILAGLPQRELSR